METIDLPEGLDVATFKKWKDTWGDLIKVMAAPEDRAGNTRLVVVKSPETDRVVCGQFEKFIDNNPDKAREILIQNCVMHGKDFCLANNYAFRSVSSALVEMIPLAKATIKN